MVFVLINYKKKLKIKLRFLKKKTIYSREVHKYNNCKIKINILLIYLLTYCYSKRLRLAKVRSTHSFPNYILCKRITNYYFKIK